MKRWKVFKLDESGNSIPTENKYLMVNIDEDYAKEVFEMIKQSEIKKGTWDEDKDITFEEFVKLI